PPLRSEHLFEDHFVCLLSSEHTLATRPQITLEEYLACSHVVVNIADGQQGAIDQRLQARGTPRRASLTVAFHAAAAAAVPGTMLVATLPWRLATNNDARDPRPNRIRDDELLDGLAPPARQRPRPTMAPRHNPHLDTRAVGADTGPGRTPTLRWRLPLRARPTSAPTTTSWSPGPDEVQNCCSQPHATTMLGTYSGHIRKHPE